MLLASLLATPGFAQPPAEGERPAGPTAEGLALSQQQLTDRYKHFEEVLLRMAELQATSDPRRAALLRKAVAQSKDRLIGEQFNEVTGLLDKDRLSRAIESQGKLNHDLKGLLDLLLSENRDKRLESEKARIAQYLRKINEAIKEQKGIQGRTAGPEDPKKLAGEQQQLADKTGKLAKDMQAHEADAAPGTKPENGKPDQGKPADSKPNQGKPDSGKPENGTPNQGKPENGRPDPGKPDTAKLDQHPPDQKPTQAKPENANPKDSPPSDKPAPGDAKPSDASKPSTGKPQPGDPHTPEGKPSSKAKPAPGAPPNPSPGGEEESSDDSSAPNQPQANDPNAARKRIEAAEKRMRGAQKKLDEARRKDASAEQEEAIRELEQAKATLEAILRQLREEEMERVLASLEARFRKMLQEQREVHEGTLRLDKLPVAERTHEHEIEAGRLGSKELEIGVEADKALLLLHEDGTAAAFSETAAQLRQDVQQIAQRLGEAKVDQPTQTLEEEVIASLEEMLDSLKKAQKSLEQKRQQPRRMQNAEPQQNALVDVLSELKLIRAMQIRVNLRTERYRKQIAGLQGKDGEQAEKTDLIEELRALGDRQQRIYQITRDLQLGKNQ